MLCGVRWKQMFEWSPHLDLIAPQDSMGANGNSFSNVSDYLSELALASRAAGRDVWSNVEVSYSYSYQARDRYD